MTLEMSKVFDNPSRIKKAIGWVRDESFLENNKFNLRKIQEGWWVLDTHTGTPLVAFQFPASYPLSYTNINVHRGYSNLSRERKLAAKLVGLSLTTKEAVGRSIMVTGSDDIEGFFEALKEPNEVFFTMVDKYRNVREQPLEFQEALVKLEQTIKPRIKVTHKIDPNYRWHD